MAAEIRALEFFCGIGGMHCALKRVAPHGVVLDAFDVSPIAAEVYDHNFLKKVNKTDLVCMTPQQLDKYAANLWMLSPPCQPHTRQGMQKGSKDARSTPFLKLLSALTQMQRPPQWLVLENVVGFDRSDVRNLMVQSFQQAGYHMQEFILSPLQYGIPCTRPRYFCLASRQPLPVPTPSSCGPCQATPSLLLQLKGIAAEQQTTQAAAQQHLASHVQYVRTISEYLWDTVKHQQQQQQQQLRQAQQVTAELAPSITTADRHDNNQQNQQQQQLLQRLQPQQNDVIHALCGLHGCTHTGSYFSASCPHLVNFRVPDHILSKYGGVIRVVSGSSRNSNCFTKSYSQYARGTGSLLATVDPVGRNAEWQLAGGIGSLVHSSSSSKLTCSAVNCTSDQNHRSLHVSCKGGVCEESRPEIILKPREVLLTPQQQQHGAAPVGASDTSSSSSYSLQRLLLGSTDGCSSSDCNTNNIVGCDEEAADMPLDELYRGPVVLRAGELVIPAEDRQIFTTEAVNQLADAWKTLVVRYFTPLEIARLHSFPPEYRFPPGMTVKQCYQLLGNSLSVAVVADLLQYMLQAECQNAELKAVADGNN